MPRLVLDRFRWHASPATKEAVVKRTGAMLKRFRTESDGFEGVEYSVMMALIIGALVSVLVLMMASVTDTFETVTTIVRR